MSVETVRKSGLSACPSVSDVLDQVFLTEGMSVQELKINKQVADIFDRLLASGRTVEDINAEWECKTQQDILCQYENFTSE